MAWTFHVTHVPSVSAMDTSALKVVYLAWLVDELSEARLVEQFGPFSLTVETFDEHFRVDVAEYEGQLESDIERLAKSESVAAALQKDDVSQSTRLMFGRS